MDSELDLARIVKRIGTSRTTSYRQFRVIDELSRYVRVRRLRCLTIVLVTAAKPLESYLSKTNLPVRHMQFEPPSTSTKFGGKSILRDVARNGAKAFWRHA